MVNCCKKCVPPLSSTVHLKLAISSTASFFSVDKGRLNSGDMKKIEVEADWKPDRRFEVAAWPGASTTSPSTQRYWVGIRILSGGFMQFIVDHFSDDIEYSSVWKKNLAQQCRLAK